MRFPLRLFLMLLLLTGLIATARAQLGGRLRPVVAELVADHTAIVPGTPFTLGVRFQMKPEWHIYWQNPGDVAGLPTTVTWELPAGFAAGPLQWPAPEKLLATLVPGEPPLVNYGYSGEVLLFATVTPPAAWTGDQAVELGAKVRWLACKDSCLPGQAGLSLKLPVAATANADPAQADRFAAARAALPASRHEWAFALSRRDDGAFVLRLRPPAGLAHDPGAITLIPAAKETIDDTATQPLTRDGGDWLLTVPAHPKLAAPPADLAGVLLAEHGWAAGGQPHALAFELAVTPDPAAAPPAAPVASEPALSLGKALLLALLGGLILNLMPCVLPVLSLKVLDVVNQAGGAHGKARLHGLVFTAGVLVSFWVLAGALLGLRAGGAALGWGFQLQEPGFVLALTALLFVFGLALFGVFEPGLALTGVGGNLMQRSGYGGSFASGVLATLVATPCTGPFMAPALGFALTQPASGALLIFTCLGLGMALPYLVLVSSPALLRFVPRPGAWMETFKQFLGFLMMATVAWLVYVLIGQAGPAALLPVLLALVVLALATWVLGRWAAPVRAPRTRLLARLVALLLAALALGGSYVVLREARPAPGGAPASGAIAWQPFAPDRIPALRAAGQAVFVDFTADWCLTCKYNERVAFTPAVGAAFTRLNIVPMVADWTARDEVIARELERHGRSGVPLYLLYPADPARPPIILPQILTEARVLEALEQR
jgi:thiol:disulfide interchange protein DsbD